MSVVSMRKLLESGCHFGHQTRKWNPKMKPYIYTIKNGVYILDLAKSMDYITVAYEAMRAIAEKSGKVLFVGTKKVAQEVVMEEALKSGAFYVNQRWLGGLLTNYRTIQKRIRRLIEINEMEESGQINLYPKKEVAQIRKEGVKLDNFLGGIKEMKKLPDALFVVDPTEDHNAVAEGRKCGIPVFGIVDTNCDPTVVDYPIPANDDGQKSVALLVTLMADAIREAKGDAELSVAYKDEEEADITMADVIVKVEEQAAESERRRRAKADERRQQQNRDRSNYRGRENRFVPRNERSKEEEKATDSDSTDLSTDVKEEPKPSLEVEVAVVADEEKADTAASATETGTVAVEEVVTESPEVTVAESEAEKAPARKKTEKVDAENSDEIIAEEGATVIEEEAVVSEEKPQTKRTAKAKAEVDNEVVAGEKPAKKTTRTATKEKEDK